MLRALVFTAVDSVGYIPARPAFVSDGEFTQSQPGPQLADIFRRGGNGCNLLLHLSTKLVSKISRGKLPGCPPSGGGPGHNGNFYHKNVSFQKCVSHQDNWQKTIAVDVCIQIELKKRTTTYTSIKVATRFTTRQGRPKLMRNIKNVVGASRKQATGPVARQSRERIAAQRSESNLHSHSLTIACSNPIPDPSLFADDLFGRIVCSTSQ